MLYRYHTDMDSCSVTAPFWDKPERYEKREMFMMGRNSGSAHGHTFYLEGRMPGV